MRFEDERYVRLYTRDSVGWKMLPWQSRALLPLLLRKVDRAGLLDLDEHGAVGLAATVELPLEVVQPGLDGLVTAGTVELRGTVLLMPKFLEAQEATATDAQRKRDQRERALARAKLDEISSRSVTSGHETGQAVTKSDEKSRAVTSGHSVPIRAVPSVPICAVPCLIPPSEGQTPSAPCESHEKSTKGKQSPEQRERAKQLRQDTEALLAHFTERWVAIKAPPDGKGPTLSKADRQQAKAIVRTHGVVEARRLVDLYCADEDPWITQRAHALCHLPRQIDRYRVARSEASTDSDGGAQPAHVLRRLWAELTSAKPSVADASAVLDRIEALANELDVDLEEATAAAAEGLKRVIGSWSTDELRSIKPTLRLLDKQWDKATGPLLHERRRVCARERERAEERERERLEDEGRADERERWAALTPEQQAEERRWRMAPFDEPEPEHLEEAAADAS